MNNSKIGKIISSPFINSALVVTFLIYFYNSTNKEFSFVNQLPFKFRFIKIFTLFSLINVNIYPLKL